MKWVRRRVSSSSEERSEHFGASDTIPGGVLCHCIVCWSSTPKCPRIKYYVHEVQLKLWFAFVSIFLPREKLEWPRS